MNDSRDDANSTKPLIIYTDDDGTERKTYSEYEIKENTISFETNHNKITIPIARLIKIKEEKR